MTAIRPLRFDAVSAETGLRTRLQRTDSVVIYQVPGEELLDAALADIEDLLDRGQPEVALRSARALDVSRSALAGPYDFLRTDAISRASLGAGDRQLLAGNRAGAMEHYDAAWNDTGTHPAVRSLADAARRAIRGLGEEQDRLMAVLRDSVRRGSFDDWCGNRAQLESLDMFVVSALRDRITSDSPILAGLESHPDVQLLDRVRAIPGSVFRIAHPPARDLALSLRLDFEADSRVPAELATPLVATLAAVSARRLVVEHGLTLTGEAIDAVPIFRYASLRDRTSALIRRVTELDGRAHDVDVRLDDLSAVFVALNNSLKQMQDAIDGLKKQKQELIQQITAMESLVMQMELERARLAEAADDCESDWWTWAAGAIAFIASPAIGVGAAFSAGVSAAQLAGISTLTSLLAGLSAAPISCGNVDEEAAKRARLLIELMKEMERRRAELKHVELKIAEELHKIENTRDQKAQAQQQDAARVLGTQALGAIRSQLNQVRSGLVTQACATLEMAQTAFNFEFDANLQVVGEAYLDPQRGGYAAGEALARDLERLEHFRVTTHRAKRQQLSHTISLRRHHTMAFIGFKATGRAGFSTDIATFDRAYPGTYLQRTKEVRVDVLVDEQPRAARGYLSNAGISSVRLPDSAARRVRHQADISVDPDPDVTKLCFMRLMRRQRPETVAFSEFDSHRYGERVFEAQRYELNFFENLGIETTWHLELLPDQDFDLARVTDVRLHVQYEALFDDTLKRLLERKRYENRRETIALSIRALSGSSTEEAFADPVTFAVPHSRLEAPYLAKQIVDVGFLVTAKGTAPIGGPATLRVGVDGGAPLALTTDATGIVATASDHPAGSGVTALAAAARGKNAHVPWQVEVVDVPSGRDVDDVLLLLQYEYVA